MEIIIWLLAFGQLIVIVPGLLLLLPCWVLFLAARWILAKVRE